MRMSGPSGGSVHALAAVCDEVTLADATGAYGVGTRRLNPEEGPDFDRSLHFSVLELAFLRDGRTIFLRGPFGWLSAPSRGSAESHWQDLTVDSVAHDALTVVLPDDAEETGDDHPWKAFVDLLSRAGVETTEPDLRAVPYHVVLAPRLHQRLTGAQR